MGLAELIMNTPVRAFSGVRSRTFRWPGESLADRVRNGWKDFKYKLNRGYDKTGRIANKLGFNQFARFTGLNKLSGYLWHFYIEGIGVPGFGGIGILPQRVQDLYERKFRRPRGISTVHSLIASIPDKASELYALSLVAGIGGPLGALGYAGMGYTGISLLETGYRALYRGITGKNIGTTAMRLGYDTGKTLYQIFQKSPKAIPTYRTFGKPYNITPINHYFGTRKLVA